MNQSKNSNYLFYGILFAGLILLLIYLLFGKWIKIPDCIFFTKFHIYCPGCGCTRAFKLMLHFNFIQSLYYNPAVLYYTITLMLYMFTSIVERILKKDISSKIPMKLLFTIGIIILIITCIIKNISLLPLK